MKPDRTLLLRIDPERGLARIADRMEDADRLEREDATFFAAVAAAYDELAAADPERFAVLDAGAPPDQVLDEALRALEPLLGGQSP